MSSEQTNKFTRWHLFTMVLLATGYAGYYFCRSNLSVVMPDLIHDLASHGIKASDAQLRLGLIASWGTVAYGVGKFISGATADMIGGRRNFLGGMAGSILFTIVFLLSGGFPLFTLAWILNRFCQSSGWVGLVKVSSRWYSYKTYGTIMGLLSLSFLFGDAIARWFMGMLLAHGFGWRGVFIGSASVLAVIAIINLVFLRETPAERGLPAPEENPLNVYASAEVAAVGIAPKTGLVHLLKPLFTSPAFLLVCVLSLGTTFLRETCLLWIPTYYVQFAGLTSAQAASNSALFPLFGGIATIIAGIVSDRLGLNGRNLVLFLGLCLTTASLFGVSAVPMHSAMLSIVMVTAVGFFLLGPYSYLAGAMSLDFGGSKGSATAAGIIDGIGYGGSFLSGGAVAELASKQGWQHTFAYLAIAASLTALVGLVLTIRQRKIKVCVVK
jgi:OPA family glycerol-3-phosphate transporter-like MFS transporter